MNYDSRIPTEAEAPLAADTNPLDQVDDEDRRLRKRNWIIAAVVAVLLIGLWFILHGKGGGDAAEANRADQAPVVSVLAPGRTTVTGKIVATGTLAARREEPVGVAGEGGQVLQVLVEAGQWVKAGQALAVIDRSVQIQQQTSLGRFQSPCAATSML